MDRSQKRFVVVTVPCRDELQVPLVVPLTAGICGHAEPIQHLLLSHMADGLTRHAHALDILKVGGKIGDLVTAKLHAQTERVGTVAVQDLALERVEDAVRQKQGRLIAKLIFRARRHNIEA